MEVASKVRSTPMTEPRFRVCCDRDCKDTGCERLQELIKAMDIPIRALLREKETPYGRSEVVE